MKFNVYRFNKNGPDTIEFDPKTLFCISDSGRTAADRMEHLVELSKNGIPLPDSGDPDMSFNPVSSILLTHQSKIDVLGTKTTGEVEFVLFVAEDNIYVTVGSDHADRKLESLQSDLSKQVCAKPVAKSAFHYEDVLPYWDEFVLSLETTYDGKTECAQTSSVTFLSHPDTIISRIKSEGLPFENGCAYFCGTIPMQDSIFRFGGHYLLSMKNHALDVLIEHEYDVCSIMQNVKYYSV